MHGVAIVLSPHDRTSWEAAGSLFDASSERIIRIRLKTHFSFATIIGSSQEASAASEAFYYQLQATLAAVPSQDMVIIMDDFNARVGSDFAQWSSVIGPHGPNERLLDFRTCHCYQHLVST